MFTRNVVCGITPVWPSSGGGLVLAVIAAAVLIGSGARVGDRRALAVILVIIGGIAVLAVAGGIAYVVHQARQDRRALTAAAPPVHQLPAAERPPTELPLAASSRLATVTCISTCTAPTRPRSPRSSAGSTRSES